MNTKVNLLRWKESGVELPNLEKILPSVLTRVSPIMQMVCARTVIMQKAETKCQTSASTLTASCMQEGFVRTVTLVVITNKSDKLKKRRRKELKPKWHFFLERNKDSANQKLMHL